MAEFDFYIEHRPGITNSVPDTLSRQPISDLPSFEEPYAPEDGVNCFILLQSLKASPIVVPNWYLIRSTALLLTFAASDL